MENKLYCTNCDMPMTEEAHFGTNADGSFNKEYCCYCLKDGMSVPICQSCGMPMTEDEHFGKDADGSVNKEYCHYCLVDGKFKDETLEEMVESCIPFALENGVYADAETARKEMPSYLRALKRWENA